MAKSPTSKPPGRNKSDVLYTHPSSKKSGAPAPVQMPPAPLTAPEIKHLAGIAAAGGKLTSHQVRELAASVLAHIEPRKKPAR